MLKLNTLCFFLLVVSNTIFAQQPNLVLPIGHTARVNTARFSPDEKRIVTSSYDKTAKIWDAVSGALLTDLIKHTAVVSSAQFSPDGNKIVTSSLDSTAIIWDSKTGIVLHILTGHNDQVMTAQFSPDGNKIVTASFDATAIIWDVAKGIALKFLKGHGIRLNMAQFSPDGKKIVTASDDQTAIIWNVETGDSLAVLKGHKSFVTYAAFSPDGNRIVTASRDKTCKVWNVFTGKLITDLTGHTEEVNTAEFSPKCPGDPEGGKYIVTASKDKTARIWIAATGNTTGAPLTHNDNVNMAQFSPDGKNIVTASKDFSVKLWDIKGNRLQEMKGHNNNVLSASFNKDGSKIVTASADKTAKIFETGTGSLLNELKGHSSLANSVQFSRDGEKFLTTYFDNSTKIWDAANGKLLFALPGYSSKVNNALFSVDGKKIVTALNDSTAKIYDVASGKLLKELKGHLDIVNYAEFSPDAKKIVTVSRDKTAKIWDAETGICLFTLVRHSKDIFMARFSPVCADDTIGGKKIVTVSDDATAIIWDTYSGNRLTTLEGHKGILYNVSFSPDGKKILTSSWDATAIIWDAATGDKLKTLTGHKYAVRSALFSPDGTKIVTASLDKENNAKVWDANSGNFLFNLSGHQQTVKSAQFSPDNKKIVTASNDGTAIIWESSSGKMLYKCIGHKTALVTAKFSPVTLSDPNGGKMIITLSNDNTAKIWDTDKGNLLYTFFSVDSTDYLVLDKDNRYDGTEAARKLLYFTCGTEVIGLNQVKDQLWVPNLAERIIKGEIINSKTLNELDICGLTPLIEDASSKADEYYFKITPQRGGLGETTLSVNGTPTKIYTPGQLKKNGDKFDLIVNKAELNNFFIPGANNIVTVKANTTGNDISSRGVIIRSARNDKISPANPNLYAVMIGVSDYKGDQLDLIYAAKDATDISTAISAAAKKLLNTNDTNHVFMYNLTTEKDHYLLPEKKSIKMVLDEIGTKAVANDILLIFFAGHGVMSGEEGKRQFYFLSADASAISTTDAPKDVGISTAELSDWMKPQNIKAQKRILIFDACQSGQAINDILKDNHQFLGARNDDKAQQIKAIDKLNEKSGLFILSASASDQSAYELRRYSHGLLTYSLLKAMKQQPDILADGKYLDVSRWFNAAEKNVTELAKENGQNQDPQIVTNTNFNIGVIDNEVVSKIVLAQEKALFAGCNFQNADQNIAADDLNLNKITDQQLNEIAARGSNSVISYVAGSNSPDAYSLSGRYKIDGNNISLNVKIRQKNDTKQQIDLKGTRDKLNELASLIASKVAEWVTTNK